MFVPSDEPVTLCYLITFLCKRDDEEESSVEIVEGSYEEATERYMEQLKIINDLNGIEVLLAADEATEESEKELAFDLLIAQLFPHGTHISDEFKEQYTLYTFPTIIKVSNFNYSEVYTHPDPYFNDADQGVVMNIAYTLGAMDHEKDWPAKFPNHISIVEMSTPSFN